MQLHNLYFIFGIFKFILLFILKDITILLLLEFRQTRKYVADLTKENLNEISLKFG